MAFIVMVDQQKSKQFQLLIEEHKGILFKVARIYCQAEEDRKDLIQEMWIQIWRSLERYNHQYKISTWLYRIALNVAISYYRKASVRQQKIIAIDNQLPYDQIDDHPEIEEKLHLLDKFIHELNNIDKALMLFYMEEKSYREIADILGMSQSNVGTRIGRIKEKLKTRFSQTIS